MSPTIEDVIAAIPAWAGREVVAEAIPAGLTNRNFRVTVDGTPVPSGEASGLLAVAASPAPTPVDVAVTAADGTTTTHYAVVLARAATAS